MIVGGMSHALGFVSGYVVGIGCKVGFMWVHNHVRLVVECIRYGNVVGLVVGFWWVDNAVEFGIVVGLVVWWGLVVGRMMTKLVDVRRLITSGHT